MVGETKRFEDHAKADISLWKAMKVFWRPLIGCAGCWFLLDITFYANSLFATQMLRNFGIGNDPAPEDSVREIVTWNLYLALISVPGYFLAIFLVDFKFTGRKWTQLGGFILVAVMYFVIGGAFSKIKSTILDVYSNLNFARIEGRIPGAVWPVLLLLQRRP